MRLMLGAEVEEEAAAEAALGVSHASGESGVNPNSAANVSARDSGVQRAGILRSTQGATNGVDARTGAAA